MATRCGMEAVNLGRVMSLSMLRNTLARFHEPHFFNEEQTQEIIESNRRYQQRTPAEQYFNDCFEVARDEHEGQFLTSSAIFAHIKKVAGADLRLSSLNHFGRILSNMPEIVRKRTKNGTEYLVKPRK